MTFAGSVVIGAMTALIAAFVQKRGAAYSQYAQLQFDKKRISLKQKMYEDEQRFNMEISMTLMCPWICYLVASGLELSGIVAILTNGIFLNQYCTPNITRASKKVIKIANETIAYSAETMVFLFLGVGVFAFDHPYEQMGAGTFILAVLNLNIARFLNISIVTWLVNRSRSESTKIGTK